MKLLHKMKISKKISIVHTLLFTTVQIIICSFLLLIIRYYYFFEASKEIKILSQQITENVMNLNDFNDVLMNPNLIPDIPEKYNVSISLFKEDSEMILHYGSVGKNIQIEAPFDEVTYKKAKNSAIAYTNHLLTDSNGNVAYLQIQINISQYLDFNNILFKILIFLTILGCVISLYTGNIVGNVVLRPLNNIIKTAGEIDSQNLDIRLETCDVEDELNELSCTINQTLERIQKSFEQQEQLISDVSHELKTPIAVIKGYANLLRQWGKDDRIVLEESIGRIDREADNMSRIVSDLLFLAKNDRGILSLEPIQFDFYELVEAIIEDTRTLNPQCDICAEKNEHCEFYGDYGLMKQMLRIIVDNGIQYSIDKCVIRITSEVQNEKIRIKIQDTGIGIAQCDIDKIFDRFYRADKARTRNKGGSGLGLSIAKAIVTTHKGRIWAESQTEQTCINMELPIF